MYDIITIGSSVVDSFIKSKSFKLQKSDEGVLLCQTYGDKVDVDEYIVRTGGAGTNTAVGFARMGFRTAVVTETGTDTFSEFIISELRKEYVATNFVVSEKSEKTGGSIILLGDDGGRTVMVHRGASAQIDPKDIPAQPLSQAKWVHISSIAGRVDTLQTIFDALQQGDTRCSWNPGNKELQAIADGSISLEALPVTVLILNKREWQLVSEKRQVLLEKIPQIIVTNGANGGEVFVDGKPNTRFMSGQVDSVDDTGAGDSFAVGYVTGQLKGKSIIDSCNWGKKNAQSVIQHIGAKPGLLTITDLESHNE